MSWLSNHTIKDKILRNGDNATRKAFYDVLSIDDLPAYIPRYPIFIVVNTQSHNLPGQHWIVVFIDKDKRGEVFDSLALPPSILLSRWMNRFSRSWRMNTLSFQHPLSGTCGGFVIYYILHRLKVSRLDDITRTLSRKLYENDERIVSFYDALE